MNYVTPIVGRWYQLHNDKDKKGGIQSGDVWIIRHTKDGYDCPYILNNRFYQVGNFAMEYRYTEVTPEQVDWFLAGNNNIVNIPKNLSYEIY